ncbi:ferritin family protein [Pyrococcus sp. ST04]|uniref:ferritin family protein n=1 Tax=Pyrococcus sp. ST04 TaxID=1183377 RepID=UPI000260587B|nr:ferritin family protein [Pyrococcus sp. ST04]AFK22176.1 hypothetical protein Py04_0574 [Pyrococcus sp. ST04]
MREELVEFERKLYNIYKLGELYARNENPKLVDIFQLLAEESLRHEKTLRTVNFKISGNITFPTIKDSPESLDELIREAIVAEEILAKVYLELAAGLDGSERDILRMMGEEALKHVYRLKLIYSR